MANITSATITLRATKGSPLTNTEVDNNFTNLNNALATGLTAASYTAADVLSKVNSLTGPTQAGGLNADTVTFSGGARSATNANTANTIVARDASGNFSAGTITANLTGTASIAASLNYTVAIAGGGTGATTASAARTALGLAIGSDVQAYTATGNALAGLTSAANTVPYFTGAGTAATTTYTAFARSLDASGDAPTARSTLGLTIGSNVQAYSGQLAAISGITTGIVALTGAGAAAGRTITAGAGISVSNGDGVSGNPTISANVTTVQGRTGDVVVSVPVTSVQGMTGDVTVTNIAGSAAHAQNAAGTTGHAANSGHGHYSQHSGHAGNAAGGWPGHLSQFANNLGNYGHWIPHGTNYGQQRYHLGGSTNGGAIGNCGVYSYGNCLSGTHLNHVNNKNDHHHTQNCHNCNCNCDCNCNC